MARTPTSRTDASGGLGIGVANALAVAEPRLIEGAERTRSVRPDLRTPEPHQIDCDWRFNAPTASYLAQQAATLGSILCVGTPTVYDSLLLSGCDACLVDRNHYLKVAFPAAPPTGVLTVDIHDLDDTVVGQEFEAAVLGPPWYTQDYILWLSRVLPLIRPAGRIFLVLFPDLVRPTASKELRWLAQRLALLGKVEPMARHAIYTTPRV